MKIVGIWSLFVGLEGFSQTPANCADYTTVGTGPPSNYVVGSANPCNSNVSGQVSGIAPWTGPTCTGTLVSTVTGPPVSCLTLMYTAVNKDDYATITTDTGGILTITTINCGVLGNVIGPYNCAAYSGDVSVTVCSTIPFNSVTLTNTGCSTGWVMNCSSQAECNGGLADAGLDELSTIMCDGTIDLNGLVTGDPTGTWTETAFPVSNAFDQGTGIFDANSAAAGIYTFEYVVTVGCTGLDSDTALFQVEVAASADASWMAPTTICANGGLVDLDALVTGTAGGTWSGTGVSGNMFDPLVGNQSIIYTVAVAACVASDTQDVTVIDLQLTTTTTNISCFGLTDGSMDVSVTGGSGAYTYIWDTAPVQTTTTATNVGAGTYMVIVTDGSCVATANVTILEPSEITATMSNVNECAPSLGSANIDPSGGVGGYTYQWNNSPSTWAAATDLDSNMHTVTVTDLNGCTYVDSILVQIFQPPVVTVTPDTTITDGEEIQLSATGGVSYSWNPTDYLDCTTCANPIASPLQYTYYCATAIDANGCTNEECVLINVITVCGNIFVPSAFSPNDDGENDILCVYGDCMEYMTFSIFNRWGEKVYQTNSTDVCWNGTWNGKKLNSAIFVYTLSGGLTNGELIEQDGNISLIK